MSDSKDNKSNLIELLYNKYRVLSDIYLLEIQKNKRPGTDYDQAESGIFTGRTSVVDSRSQVGTIRQMGPDCEGYNIGDKIYYDLSAGLDIEFKDEENKFILIGAEKFLGVIND